MTVRLLPRDAVHKRSLCRRGVSVRMSVCPSVTFLYFVKTRKHIFKIFPPSGSQTILVFRIKRHSNIPTGTPPNNEGVECRWDRQTSRFSTNIWIHRVLSTVLPPSVIHTTVLDRDKLVTLIAGKRRRLLFAGDGRRSVYDKKPQLYAEDNRTAFNCTQW